MIFSKETKERYIIFNNERNEIHTNIFNKFKKVIIKSDNSKLNNIIFNISYK
jgi:hypothetical protein